MRLLHLIVFQNAVELRRNRVDSDRNIFLIFAWGWSKCAGTLPKVLQGMLKLMVFLREVLSICNSASCRACGSAMA